VGKKDDSGTPGKKPAKALDRSGETGEVTRVDLGDDLIEKTADLIGVPQPRSSEISSSDGTISADPFESIDSRMHSARILIGEGMLEQAKKLLHHILVTDKGYVPARQALEEIHETELKQIFGEDRRGDRRRAKQNALHELWEDPSEVVEQLDNDLRLGLFQDSESMGAFTRNLDATLADSTPQDLVDLGIGFLEIGLCDLAAQLFRKAADILKREQSEDPDAVNDLTAAVALEAYALILAGKPFDAIATMQGLLNDSEIQADEKLELFYLMGRAYDSLKKPEMALQWYFQVKEIDPRYRDVQDRLRKRCR